MHGMETQPQLRSGNVGRIIGQADAKGKHGETEDHNRTRKEETRQQGAGTRLSRCGDIAAVPSPNSVPDSLHVASYRP